MKRPLTLKLTSTEAQTIADELRSNARALETGGYSPEAKAKAEELQRLALRVIRC
jgi:hypothetical protein